MNKEETRMNSFDQLSRRCFLGQTVKLGTAGLAPLLSCPPPPPRLLVEDKSGGDAGAGESKKGGAAALPIPAAVK